MRSPKLIYNFGRADQLDADQLRRLAASILRVVPDETAPPAATIAAGDGDVRIRDSWPYGGFHVLEQLWKELDLAAVLKGCAKARDTKQPFERRGGERERVLRWSRAFRWAP